MRSVLTCLLALGAGYPLHSATQFLHGIASGDPAPDSVVLWTRATPDAAGPVTLTWQISTTPEFTTTLQSGTFQTDANRDYTVKVIPTGLQAGTTYYYRFLADNGAAASETGRTKTLPTGEVGQVRLAVFSCANITADPFDAYAKAARIGDYDALVHTGDYIYEYGLGGYPEAEGLAEAVGFEPDRECITLEDYRLRYAQYHRAPKLQAARASAPFIVIWDDHETANDAYAGGAQNHSPAIEGSWTNRVSAALQAYYEWQPIREPASGDRRQAYRSFDFGNLVSLHMLETRLNARDLQLDLAPTQTQAVTRIGAILADPTLVAQYATTYGLSPPTGPGDTAGITAFSTALGPIVTAEFVTQNVTQMYTGDRKLLGAEQLQWLQGQLAGSGATWQVLGQQVLMGNMTMPAELLIELASGSVSPATIVKYLTPVTKRANGLPLTPAEQAVLANANPLPYNSDAWDGYGRERETVLQTAASLGKKLVVFAGDTHNAWSSTLRTFSAGPGVPAGTVAGIEFAAPGVSSPGIERYFPGQQGILRDLFLGYSPNLKFANLANRGFLDVTFKPDGVTAKFYLRERSADRRQWLVETLSGPTPSSISQSAPTSENDNYRLQILHASDMEADVVTLETAPRFAALVDRLEDNSAVDASITLAAGDIVIPGAFLSAGNDPSTVAPLKTVLGLVFNFDASGAATDLRESAGRPDIAILNAIGFDAASIGNHEFDLGPTEFASMILPDVRSGGLPRLRNYGAAFPLLSANLDFSGVPTGESALAARSTQQILPASRFGANPSTDASYVSTAAADIAQHPKLATATIIERGTEKIGVLGVTPPDLANISSPGSVRVTGPQGSTATSPRTYDIAALAAHLQPVIDALRTNGCTKIVLSSQLQQIDNEKALAQSLDGVDVIVAGGSGTIYVNDPANLLPGDTAAGRYPFLTTDKLGRTVAVVSTEGQYQYLGQLVVDFDNEGNVLGVSGDTLPTTAAKVTSLWGASDPFAPGTRGAAVKVITDAIGSVINSKDGLILGRASVYLEGRRTTVRQQESNFGNLSADANLWYAQQYDPAVQVSLKNGGGIRNSIGSTGPAGELLPTRANPSAGKIGGDISRLDIEDSLKFNNALTVLSVNAGQLKLLLEHGVAASTGTGADRATPGQFCQLGGIVVVADLTQPAQRYTSAANVISAVTEGQRIRFAALLDENGQPGDVLVADGEVLNPGRTIRLVTLNFLANPGAAGSDFGGDSYPFPYINRLNGNLAYDRRDLNSATLTPPLPATFPALASFALPGTEQDAFAEYLQAFHKTTPFAQADTSGDRDRRLVQGTADTDGDGFSNAEETSLFSLGMSPDRSATASQTNALLRLRRQGQSDVVGTPSAFNLFTSLQVDEARLAGRTDVVSDPAPYGLYTAPRADIRLDGLILPFTNNAVVTFKLQSSDDFTTWTDAAVVPNVSVDLTTPAKYFRFRAE
ncbi:MAG: alkaline phosphatase D family protein [Verrucomicrobia bacterium]|nr:alkaline phosphatase D family protein [Verrucomicrobiota bacterium]